MKSRFNVPLLILCLVVAFATACTVKVKDLTGPTDDRTLTISVFKTDVGSAKVGTQVLLTWEVLESTARVRIDPEPGNVGTTGSAMVTVRSIGSNLFEINATPTSTSAGALPARRTVTVTGTP